MAYNSGKPLHGDDICIWSDNTYCDGRELHEMSHMSDDYIRIPVDCEIWLRFVNGEEPMTYDAVVLAIREELAAIN